MDVHLQRCIRHLSEVVPELSQLRCFEHPALRCICQLPKANEVRVCCCLQSFRISLQTKPESNACVCDVALQRQSFGQYEIGRCEQRLVMSRARPEGSCTPLLNAIKPTAHGIK